MDACDSGSLTPAQPGQTFLHVNKHPPSLYRKKGVWLDRTVMPLSLKQGQREGSFLPLQTDPPQALVQDQPVREKKQGAVKRTGEGQK